MYQAAVKKKKAQGHTRIVQSAKTKGFYQPPFLKCLSSLVGVFRPARRATRRFDIHPRDKSMITQVMSDRRLSIQRQFYSCISRKRTPPSDCNSMGSNPINPAHLLAGGLNAVEVWWFAVCQLMYCAVSLIIHKSVLYELSPCQFDHRQGRVVEGCMSASHNQELSVPCWQWWCGFHSIR